MSWSEGLLAGAQASRRRAVGSVRDFLRYSDRAPVPLRISVAKAAGSRISSRRSVKNQAALGTTSETVPVSMYSLPLSTACGRPSWRRRPSSFRPVWKSTRLSNWATFWAGTSAGIRLSSRAINRYLCIRASISSKGLQA